MGQYFCSNLGECFRTLSSVLGCELRRIIAIVAYIKKSGVDELQSILGKSVLYNSVMVAGLDFYLTEPSALRKLMNLGTKVLVYTGYREFHPKLYLVECSNGHEYLIAGSSNISRGAIIGDNIEANVLISDRSIISKAKILIEEVMQQSISVKDIIVEYEKRYNDILARFNKYRMTSLNLKYIPRDRTTFQENKIKINYKSTSINNSVIDTSGTLHKGDISTEVLSGLDLISSETKGRKEHVKSQKNVQNIPNITPSNKEGDVSLKQHNKDLKSAQKSARIFEVDTFSMFHVDTVRARTYIARLLRQLIKQGLLELPRDVGEKKTITLVARVYRPVPRAYEKLRHGQVQKEVIKCMHIAIGNQAGKKKKRAFWEALGLLLIAFRYGIKIVKKVGEKRLALAREYDGAFKSRREKNKFALKLVKCLKEQGLAEISNNLAMPNLERFRELGLYEIVKGKLRLDITKVDNLTYKITSVLLEPFKLQSKDHILHKDDILNSV